MEPQNPYITRAEEIIGSLDLAELVRTGILRERHSYDFIVQYPPPMTYEPMNGGELYGC
jgi:hypothetical protein